MASEVQEKRAAPESQQKGSGLSRWSSVCIHTRWAENKTMSDTSSPTSRSTTGCQMPSASGSSILVAKCFAEVDTSNFIPDLLAVIAEHLYERAIALTSTLQNTGVEAFHVLLWSPVLFGLAEVCAVKLAASDSRAADSVDVLDRIDLADKAATRTPAGPIADTATRPQRIPYVLLCCCSWKHSKHILVASFEHLQAQHHVPRLQHLHRHWCQRSRQMPPLLLLLPCLPDCSLRWLRRRSSRLKEAPWAALR